MQRLANLCVSFFLIVGPVCAQAKKVKPSLPSVWVDGVELTIGMRQEPLLQKLRSMNLHIEKMQIQGVEDSGTWCVVRQSDPCATSLEFVNEKLILVNSSLDSAEGEDAAALLSRLFGILHDSTIILIQKGEFEDHSRFRHRTLRLNVADGKWLEIDIAQPVGSSMNGPSTIALTERIQGEEAKKSK